ncbi:MAG: glycosyltransferase [Chitinophagaceae bacterium]|nr:glycosyltransferase [Chitinophagaceae bacterium]
MQKLISIIIPAYNAGQFISETIKSVINQSYANWELIVIDDGSQDNTSDIVQENSKKDSRIRIVKQTNSGVSSARNKGLENSTGDHVCFLDADDLLEAENLKTKLQALEKNGWDAVYSACELIDRDGRPLNRELGGQLNPTLNDILELKGNYITAPSGFLYKRAIFKVTGGYDPELSNNADQELFTRILYNNFKIGYIPSILWKYRIHSSNMSGNIQLLEKDSIYMFNKLKQQNVFKTKKYEKKCYAKLYYMLGGSWWKQGNNRLRGCQFFIRSFFSSPSIILNNLFNK